MTDNYQQALLDIRTIFNMGMSPEEWAHAKVEGTASTRVSLVEDARRFLTRDFIFVLVDEGKWDQIEKYLMIVVPLMRLDRANARIVMKAGGMHSDGPNGFWWVSKEDLPKIQEEHKENVHPDQCHSINKRYTIIRDNIKNDEVRAQMTELLKPCAPEYLKN